MRLGSKSLVPVRPEPSDERPKIVRSVIVIVTGPAIAPRTLALRLRSQLVRELLKRRVMERPPHTAPPARLKIGLSKMIIIIQYPYSRRDLEDSRSNWSPSGPANRTIAARGPRFVPPVTDRPDKVSLLRRPQTRSSWTFRAGREGEARDSIRPGPERSARQSLPVPGPRAKREPATYQTRPAPARLSVLIFPVA